MGRKHASTRKETSQAPGAEAAYVPGDQSLSLPGSRSWIRRFLLLLLLVFLGLALVLGAYNLYVDRTLRAARSALDSGSLEGLALAVDVCSTPHLFAGYEPYHGFGRESAAAWLAKTEAIMESGNDYSPEELGFLIHRPDFFLAAWSEVRTDQNPPVPGDSAVLRSVLERNVNAVGNAWVAAIYLLSVVAILLIPWFLYRPRVRP